MFKRWLRKIKSFLVRFFGYEEERRKGLVKATRSSKWPTTRKNFLGVNPTCAACGCEEKLNVHHIKPYHLHPELELDKNNLITLCEKHGCHLLIGHLCSFRSYNEDVVEDAAVWLKKIKNRP